MIDDVPPIPDFLRRSNTKENTAMAKQQKIEEEVTEAAANETRPTKAQFLEAATAIDEIDAKIEAIHAKVAAEIEGLNDDRNKASDVVRKYLGRKR